MAPPKERGSAELLAGDPPPGSGNDIEPGVHAEEGS